MIAYATARTVMVVRNGETIELADKSSLTRLLAGDPCGLPEPMRDPVRISRQCIVERAAVTETRGDWNDGYWVRACGRWLSVSRRCAADAMRAIGHPKVTPRANPAAAMLLARARRALPETRRNHEWTQAQDIAMLELIAAGVTLRQAASELQRIRPGVTARAVDLRIRRLLNAA